MLSYESESERKSLEFNYFVSVACCRGLCMPNMIIMKANAKENLGEVFLPFHCESESEIKSPDFHL